MTYAVPSTRQPKWILSFIWTGAIFFLFALAVSAAFEADLRVLHPLQALIYVAVVLLMKRNSAFGFGAGCFISLFWSYVFLAAARVQVWALMTGHAFRPDIALQLAAVGAHVLIFTACIAGFLRLHPQRIAWIQFLGGGAIVVGYLLLITALLRPEILPAMERAFGL